VPISAEPAWGPGHGDPMRLRCRRYYWSDSKVDPAVPRQIGLHPGGRCAPPTIRSAPVSLPEGRYTRCEASGQPMSAGFHHEHSEIPTTPSPGLERLAWLCTPFSLRRLYTSPLDARASWIEVSHRACGPRIGKLSHPTPDLISWILMASAGPRFVILVCLNSGNGYFSSALKRIIQPLGFKQALE